jgi:DNA-binding LytR/AlgR family response regulator
MIRVLIVDDEALAIERLRDLLSQFAEVEVAGTATGGRAALEQAAELRPDAILLDVEMPVLDGFDVVEELARSERAAPLIVFVTAYPQFAVNAFETGAIDFLTKPVRLSRLEVAIERLRTALESRSARTRLDELAGQLESLRAERGAQLHERNYVWVQSRGESIRVDLDRVDWIEAEGEYVRLFVGETSYLHRESVTGMMQRLNPQRFMRIHRSYLINRDRIAAVKRRPTGSYQIVMDSRRELPVGRSYRSQVRAIILERRSGGGGSPA